MPAIIGSQAGPGAGGASPSAPVTSTPSPSTSAPSRQASVTPSTSSPATKQASVVAPKAQATSSRVQPAQPRQARSDPNGNFSVKDIDEGAGNDTARNRPMDFDEFDAQLMDSAAKEKEALKQKKDSTDSDNVEGSEGEASNETETEKPDTEVSFDTEGLNESEGGEESDTSAEGETQPNNGKRDYSQYDKEVADVLRKLPNSLYAKYADKLQQWKKDSERAAELDTKLEIISKEKPRFLAEHPESFRISKEYRTAVEAFTTAKEVRGGWESQLARIEQGLDWVELKGYDEQGQPILVNHPAPENGQIDFNAKMLAQRELQKAYAQETRYDEARRDIARNYRQFQAEATTQVKDMIGKLFKGQDPAKLTGEDAKYFKAVNDMLPGVYADNPLAPALGLAFVNHRRLAVTAQKLAAELKALKAGKSPAARTAPAVGPRGTAGGVVNGKANDNIDLNELYKYED